MSSSNGTDKLACKYPDCTNHMVYKDTLRDFCERHYREQTINPLLKERDNAIKIVQQLDNEILRQNNLIADAKELAKEFRAPQQWLCKNYLTCRHESFPWRDTMLKHQEECDKWIADLALRKAASKTKRTSKATTAATKAAVSPTVTVKTESGKVQYNRRAI